MTKQINITSWWNRLKIHALFCSCSALICYTTVTHSLSNISPHLLVATTNLFLFYVSRLQGLLGRTVSYHALFQCTGKCGVWLLCGILAAGEIKTKLKKKKLNTASFLHIFSLPAFFTRILLCFHGVAKNLYLKDSFPVCKYYSWIHIFWLVHKSKHLFCTGFILIHHLYRCKWQHSDTKNNSNAFVSVAVASSAFMAHLYYNSLLSKTLWAIVHEKH